MPATRTRWIKYTAIGLLSLAVAVTGTILIAQRVSDGPMGPLQGGAFKTGLPATMPADNWQTLLGGPDGNLDFELLGFGTSRTTGALVHEGELYIPCDLGYMWGRTSGAARIILKTIYIFKTWHHDAVEDGRARVKIQERLYDGSLRKVANSNLAGELRALLDARYLDELGPPPTDGPRDIWFFRFVPSL